MVSYQDFPKPSEKAAQFWREMFEGRRNCTTCRKKNSCKKIRGRLNPDFILPDEILRWMCCEDYEP